MKTLAFVVGTLIAAAGVAIFLFPSGVTWLAQHPPTSLELYSSAVIRVLIGVLFIAGAPTARIPWLLQALGAIAIIAGAAALFIGVERATAIADWTAHQPVAVIRLLGFLPLVLGALVVYASGPVRRAV